ncbi:MAG: hypothetical protein Q8M29_02090 [Bacteroidota bacterium]|nr:hypothetical protein [Bacteroidota bacterium]
MTKKTKYTENDIKSVDTSEWFKIRLFQNAEIDTLYVIMGCLQEYFGGYSLDEETVDVFFVDEFEKAKIFQGICEHYLKSLNTESDIKLIKTETGHSYLQSKIICRKLKEHFSYQELDFLNHKCYRLSEENDLFKTAEQLYGDRNKMFNFKRYSYLLGVLIKNKLENKPAINFANAGHKAELAIKILKEFDAFGEDTFRVDYFFRVPHVTRITLSDNNAIWSELDEYKKRIKTTANSGYKK